MLDANVWPDAVIGPNAVVVLNADVLIDAAVEQNSLFAVKNVLHELDVFQFTPKVKKSSALYIS